MHVNSQGRPPKSKLQSARDGVAGMPVMGIKWKMNYKMSCPADTLEANRPEIPLHISDQKIQHYPTICYFGIQSVLKTQTRGG
jgi:hypothetical protein